MEQLRRTGLVGLPMSRWYFSWQKDELITKRQKKLSRSMHPITISKQRLVVTTKPNLMPYHTWVAKFSNKYIFYWVDYLKKHILFFILFFQEVQNTRDECTIFGELVAVGLRSITDRRTRLIVQHQINNLLFEAQMGGQGMSGSTSDHELADEPSTSIGVEEIDDKSSIQRILQWL